MWRHLVLFFSLLGSLWAQQEPFDARALMKVLQLSDPQISPDGRKFTFTAARVDLEKNKKIEQIYVMPVEGGSPRQLTSEGSTNQRARWSPDSRHLFFISDRGGSAQVWMMGAGGENPRPVTRIATEAAGLIVAPNGKQIVFTSEVYPDCADDACNQQKLEAEKSSPVKARIYTSLLYRHWNEWQGQRRRHVLVADIAGGAPRDLTPGPRDAPPFALGEPDGYAVSPDSQELSYVINNDPELAVSTNSDIYAVSLDGGQPRQLTRNVGADTSPQYAPDGKYIAYRAQLRGGYESDRWRLVVYNRATGQSNILTESLDRPVSSLAWSHDSGRLFFTVEDRGRQAIQMIPVTGGGARVVASGASFLGDVQLSPDGKTMICTEQSASRPVEIVRISSAGGAPVALTHMNDALWSRHRLQPAEEFWVEGAQQARVHSFLVKPHGFQEGRKYPVLFLIHGGPQGAWGESWTYRWNAQVFAAAGYVVVMPNPRGSTGYGQQFTDEINADWGGRVYDDILAVVDHVARQPWADAERMVAAGGSYGGYMVNWMLGHTGRFKALVSHAGVYDLRSMFGETEELWFPLWDLQGTPWDKAETYGRWSPSHFVKEFKTPTLVIHGEQDFRVPYGQGLQLYTSLQLQKVPSKLLLFPDEGHWVEKPQNSLLWYKTVTEWLDEWVKKR